MGIRKGMLLAPLAALLLSAAALAPAFADPISFSGTGNLTASGSGTITAGGDGWVILTGNGTLKVRDDAGDLQLTLDGTGTKSDAGDGWTQYSGFGGSAKINGSKFEVSLSGDSIWANMSGNGLISLDGSGDIWTSDANGQHVKQRAHSG